MEPRFKPPFAPSSVYPSMAGHLPATSFVQFLRHLVDLTWGFAHEDQSVPSQHVADKLIDKARASFKLNGPDDAEAFGFLMERLAECDAASARDLAERIVSMHEHARGQGMWIGMGYRGDLPKTDEAQMGRHTRATVERAYEMLGRERAVQPVATRPL